MNEQEIISKISPLIPYQFPAIFRDEGPVFVQFVKAYYEWMEESGNVLDRSRNMISYLDIDKTLEEFLVHFQKKYLYGIPFDVIINKRFLLKHVLDVYRSKGSIQCYKLLFRLIYNEDVDIYLPGRDVIRSSDGTWKDVRYIEINNQSIDLQSYVGDTIIGLSSGTVAVVESFALQPINTNLISVLYLSNITPRSGDFTIGEKLIRKSQLATKTPEIVSAAPVVVGSLDSIEIQNGGRQFVAGDLLKIVHRDLITGDEISRGVDGIVRVVETVNGRGTIQFAISHEGFGITDTANVNIYNALADTSGNGASFNIGSLADLRSIRYNTDIIADYADVALNSLTFGFPGNPAGNVSTPLSSLLTFTNSVFGSLASITNFRTGQNYTDPLNIHIRSTLVSNARAGTISYNSATNVITGTGTNFSRFFANNDMIIIQANSSLSDTAEHHVIKEVTNTTSMALYGSPVNNSTASATHRMAPTILPANFPPYDPTVNQLDGTIAGLNSNVSGIPAFGNSIIKTVTAINSGKGYVQNEEIKMYLYGALDTLTIANGGLGYTNGDVLIFSGGNANRLANGYVSTDSNGMVTSTSLTYAGSGYTDPPTITIRTNTGNGAVINATVSEFNTVYEVSGLVKKAGIGRQPGYWTTTRGFLNSDKYIHDSYFYQDFSYQIRAALTSDKYRNILYDTFHTSGTEMFGEYLKLENVTDRIELAQTGQTNASIIDISAFMVADSTQVLTADFAYLTIDSTMLYGASFRTTSDISTITADISSKTADESGIVLA
jgi:hypothetical protein